MHGPSETKLDPNNYRNIGALANYIDRIGGEQRSFRRFVVKGENQKRYHYDKTVITLNTTNHTLRCVVDGKEVLTREEHEHAPTEEERAAIEKALADPNIEWPKSIPCGGVDELIKVIAKAHKRINPTLFVYYDTAGKNVVFVQERLDPKDGELKKDDLPWSYWNDKKWRMMEPDGLLPLWGLEQLANRFEVFIHEGAKTAQYVKAMMPPEEYCRSADEQQKRRAMRGNEEAEELKRAHPHLTACPWIGALKGYAHLGWPGGAPNPHRVDWEPIRKLPRDVKVTIVADHDMAGVDAVPKISRALGRHVGVIRFGGDFPANFDLADPFPAALFKEKNGARVWDGPSFEDCWSPATWATRVEKKNCSLRQEFIDEWINCVKPALIIHRDRLDLHYTKEEFNKLIAPFSDIENVAALLNKSFSVQANTIVYEPGRRSGPISMNGQRVANVYRPSTIRPIKGDVTPFLQFMDHLIPDPEDRRYTLRWTATLSARPDIRMFYSLLLFSLAQGVGKTTLAMIAARLVGLHNTSFPSGERIVQRFNNWVVYKRLAVVAEIFEGNSRRTYNSLKDAITDVRISAELKNVPAFDINSQIHVFASTNSPRALKIDDEDRRWFVPGVTEKQKDLEYWKALHSWLGDEGIPIIAQWAKDFVAIEGNTVETGERPPATKAKERMILDTMSEGERLISDFADELLELKKQKIPVVVRLDFLREWLKVAKGGGTRYLESSETINKILKSKGLAISDYDHRFKEDRKKFMIAANFNLDEYARMHEGGLSWGDLQRYEKKPNEVLNGEPPMSM
jgi:hypothetical protein